MAASVASHRIDGRRGDNLHECPMTPMTSMRYQLELDPKGKRSTLLALAVLGVALVGLRLQRPSTTNQLVVFSSWKDEPIAVKQRFDLAETSSVDKVRIKSIVLDLPSQREFLRRSRCGTQALERFDALLLVDRTSLATEVWKYCAIAETPGAAGFLDLGNPMVERLQDVVQAHDHQSIAILDKSYMPQSFNGAFILLQPHHKHIAEAMLDILVNAEIRDLVDNPTIVPRSLYVAIASRLGTEALSHDRVYANWTFFEQSCTMMAHAIPEDIPIHAGWFAFGSFRLSHHCPLVIGFCCSVRIPSSSLVVQMLRNPIFPLEDNAGHQPDNSDGERDNAPDLSVISSLRVFRTDSATVVQSHLGLTDQLLRNNCLPSDRCNECLRNMVPRRGTEDEGCGPCMTYCSCYCRMLCQIEDAPLPTSLHVSVTPPAYGHDQNRMIPQIVHQHVPDSFPETQDWYPDTSRTIKSFQTSGWDHRSYLEADMEGFLKTHFPDEVLEAYRALIPFRMKLDLFRYCVLLIHGGVFVNSDVLLVSNLDEVFDPDLGFVAAGEDVDACLWPGFIGSAPGHPFVAKAIELVVNQIRNRFTIFDIDKTLCPRPVLPPVRSSKEAFLTGSCLLGKSVNSGLFRYLQTPFETGEVSVNRTTAVFGTIPGKTLVLRINEADMGGKRLSLVSRNLLVAQLDMPVSDYELDEMANVGRYEFEALYVDHDIAGENVEFYIQKRPLWQ